MTALGQRGLRCEDRSMFDFSEEAGFTGLFFASFLSATLLPGGSEIVLVAMIEQHPERTWPAVAVATIGNTLGGAVSYLIGRLFPNRVAAKAVERLRRDGIAALLFSWAPFVGDALCVGAGWLRFNPWLSFVAIALGKFARYGVVAGGWKLLASIETQTVAFV